MGGVDRSPRTQDSAATAQLVTRSSPGTLKKKAVGYSVDGFAEKAAGGPVVSGSANRWDL
ncbi:unnamed protein product [Fusarium graminearum]|uniref:Uncharacterized protein n=1 Tax=Gibberella zeae TaxID=5518 RepID=A0A4U9FK39_GIBZA|nr:unnamed protein product [Fusarium graminearum]CAF3586990.1 unnamed protein product [Fusarium graminearum]CAF3599855.1 unnamed protein product [Fusarium graminearum]CAG1982496.1 unnamed protein product [Fusarium graminearum]CAG1986405.1 unnamed protein product [Fusarium graminearum]